MTASADAYWPVTVDTGQLPLNGTAYSPPSGKQIYKIVYSVEYLQTAIDNSSNGTGGLSNAYAYGGNTILLSNSLNPVLPAAPTFPESGGFGSCSSGDIVTDTYQPTFWKARIVAAESYTSFVLRNMTAVVYLKQLQTNSATPANNFTFQNYAWNISGSTAIAVGSLNWMAVGD